MVSIRLTLFMEHNNNQMLDFFRYALYRKSTNQVAWIWQWLEQIYLQTCIHDLIEDIVCLFFPMCVCIHVQCVRIHNVVWEEEIGRRGEIGSSGEKKV